MKRSRTILSVAVLAGMGLAALIARSAHSQPQGIVPKLLLRTTVSGDDTRETVIATAEFAPGGTTGRHTHPGDEYAVVLQGTLEIRIEGQEPRRVNAGEAYHNAKGVIHETVNIGTEPARVASTFVIEKGKPVSEPVQR
ncbi:MAG TPA: cupin domain-containing protein [Thermoanaerobaculia bacterium]|nr:cupin domain-containing protein [Thermoanaerobaculia bacterium]